MNFKQKDINKFHICNKLISQGAPGSSSAIYAEYDYSNTGDCERTDIVGISVNGNRRNRVSFNKELVTQAIEVGSQLVTDNNYHTNRPFNIGERELAKFLNESGCKLIYSDQHRNIWRKDPLK